MLEITTAATVRPEILRRTYSSFRKYLFRDLPCRVYLNVDPVGDTHLYDPEEIVHIAQQYFEDVQVRLPEEPGFPTALMWLWDQVQGDYYFNLEDDWEIHAPVSLDNMIRALTQHQDLALLRLAKRDSDENTAQFYDSAKPRGVWNGSYYDVPGLIYSGMPSLIRTKYIRQLREHMHAGMNHERLASFLHRTNHPMVQGWKYGGYTEPNLDLHLVQNIGVEWRKERGIIKRWSLEPPTWQWEQECDD